jgi:hypothetical protein
LIINPVQAAVLSVHNMSGAFHPAPLTRSGKSLGEPSQSSLFARNPCPQKKYFAGLAHDFVDEHQQRYWLAQQHDKLQRWFGESELPQMLESEFDSQRDAVLYVDKQDANKMTESGAYRSATVLQAGDSLALTARQPHTRYSCQLLIAVGQRTVDSSASTRRIRWVHVRDLQPA